MNQKQTKEHENFNKSKKFEIVEIAKYNNGLTQSEALETARKNGLRLITNNEADAILQNKELYNKYKDYFPLWTGTRVEYNGTNCKVMELGKTYNIKIPSEDGWHETDKFGIPSGSPSNSGNPNARHLWRISSYKGLLSRGDRWYGYGGRIVVAYDYCYYRFGVLGVRKTQTKTRRR